VQHQEEDQVNVMTDTGAYLRETAKLIRERASHATTGRWEVGDDGFGQPGVRTADSPIAECVAHDPGGPLTRARLDARHIASWDPAVALAVADLIDKAADVAEYCATKGYDPQGDAYLAAIAVARAYRREPTS
jgi:hypothetical protein